MPAYHFLPQEWAFDDIRKKRLKISLIEDLNDPFELMGIDTSDPEVRQAIQDTRRELASKNGVLCFSRSWSNPVLWSHYADGALHSRRDVSAVLSALTSNVMVGSRRIHHE